jgi:simple sugar transport system permease protein
MTRRAKLIILAVTLILVVLLSLQLSGQSMFAALKGLLGGSLGSLANISGTLKETTPLLMLGVGVYLALRAGLFNIGIEGQYTVGALACSAVVTRIGGVPGMLLGLGAGIAAGAAWAYLPGWIKAIRGGHEVITTIMLNNVALYLSSYLIAGPMKPADAGYPITAEPKPGTMLPVFKFGSLQISVTLILGIIAVVVLRRWLQRSVAGYELQATGANPRAGSYAGINVKSVTIRAMLVSGAIGGLAGAFQLLTFQPKFQEGFSSGYGYDALGVALLASSSPYLLVPAAFFFGLLNKGGQVIALDGIPKGVTSIVLACVVIFVAALRYQKEAVND